MLNWNYGGLENVRLFSGIHGVNLYNHDEFQDVKLCNHGSLQDV